MVDVSEIDIYIYIYLFFFFFLPGGGEGEVRGAGRGGVIENPRRGGGGVSREEGREAGRVSAANWRFFFGGGGLNIFFRGRNVHQESYQGILWEGLKHISFDASLGLCRPVGDYFDTPGAGRRLGNQEWPEYGWRT